MKGLIAVPRLEAGLSLRRKIYLIVGLTLLIAVAVIFLVSQTVFMRGFKSVENTQMQEQIKRAQAAVNWNLVELGGDVVSYASWDDTITFLEQRDQKYIDSNLPKTFFTGFKANLAVILDQDGSVVYGTGYDLENDKKTPLPAGLTTTWAPKARSLDTRGRRRSLRHSDAPLRPHAGRFAARSQSDAQGPVRGTFIMGRWLNNTTWGSWARHRPRPCRLPGISTRRCPVRYGKQPLPPDPKRKDLCHSARPRTRSPDTRCFRISLDRPAAVIQVLSPRAIYAQGASKRPLFHAFARPFWCSSLAWCCTCCSNAPFSGGLPVSRPQVRHMGPGRAKLVPISVGGHDELDLLAETINAGFSQLETTRNQQEIQAQSLATTLDELKGRHQDLEKAHVRLQQLQHVSASLGRHFGDQGRTRAAGDRGPRYLRGGRDMVAQTAGQSAASLTVWGRSSGRSPARRSYRDCSVATDRIPSFLTRRTTC